MRGVKEKHSLTQNIHTFFYKPYELVKKSVMGKVGVVALSALAGIPTLGIAHLVAYLIRDKFSKFSQDTQKIQKVAKNNLPSSYNVEVKVVNKKEAIKKMGKLSDDQKNKRMKMFDKFLKNQMSQEGIFRLSGDFKAGLELTESFLKEEFSGFDETIDVNTVASLFKDFIKSCKLFEDENVKKIIIQASEKRDEIDKINCLKNGIDQMDSNKRKLLISLFSILQSVVDKNELNKMDDKNLSIVFGPNLIPVFDKNNLSYNGILIQNNLTLILIKNLKKILPPEETSIEETEHEKTTLPREDNLIEEVKHEKAILSTEDKMKGLSPTDKQQRMDGFVELFQGQLSPKNNLFSKDGDPENIERLSRSFVSPTFSWFEEKENINDLVSLFKNFIKSCELFAEVQGLIPGIEKETKEEKQLELWKELIKQMPEAKQKLLKYLLSILNDVAKKPEKSVNPRIFAVRFGPLLVPKINPSFSETNTFISVTGSLIDFYVGGKLNLLD